MDKSVGQAKQFLRLSMYFYETFFASPRTGAVQDMSLLTNCYDCVAAAESLLAGRGISDAMLAKMTEWEAGIAELADAEMVH